MFIRTAIGKLNEDGSIEAIHLYCDSDTSNTYSVLTADYVEQAKVEELLELGDLISLGKYISGENPTKSPSRDVCLAFQRDDGLTGMEAQFFLSLESWLRSFYMCQLAFLFDGKKWQTYERTETERKTKNGLEVMGFWMDHSSGYRVTGVFDFAESSRSRSTQLRQANSAKC